MAEYIGQILYIKPNMIVSVPEFDTPKNYFSSARIENQRNLKFNKHNSKLSDKAVKRIKSAINWLVASAKEKKMYHPKTKKNYNFKVNLITLTLPDTAISIKENDFKTKLMHPFLMYMKKFYKLNNYVWKIEFQDNGKLHVHLTSDTYLDKDDIRRVWNNRLRENGYLKDYFEKFNGCTFDEYLKLMSIKDLRTTEQKYKAWLFGTSSKWQHPNTTDVHAVWKVKNLGAYLAKYMSKNEQNTDIVNGRIWGCSHELSDKNKCVLGVNRDECHEVLKPLMNPNIEYKEIVSQDSITGKVFRNAELFFIKAEQWHSIIHGKIKEAYDKHRFYIRNGISHLKADNELITC